jgi:hypothetical protein
MNADGVVMAGVSLIRPALETAGLAYYMLDPGINQQERARRWMNIELDAYVERLRLLSEGDRLGAEGFEWKRGLYWLRKNAERAGLPLRTVKQRWSAVPDYYIDPRPPSDQRIITDLLAEVGEETGATVQRMTSAVMHGKVHGMSAFMLGEAATPSPHDGYSMVPMGATLQRMTIWVMPALIGLRTCVYRASSYYNWDLASWEKVFEKAMAEPRQWMGPWT